MADLRSLLCIGGVDVRLQCDEIRKGIHVAVSTPGRLKVWDRHGPIMQLRMLATRCCIDYLNKVDLGNVHQENTST